MTDKKLLEIEFLICPRDFLVKEISLAPQTILSLNHAAKFLRENSGSRYQLVLTRGYVRWSKWRCFRGQFAKFIFCLLYRSDRKAAQSLFGHNGHNDGLSVDVLLYDTAINKKITWLSWKNIFISRVLAEKIIARNTRVISMLDKAMSSAGFISHDDPREKLQAHYRLNCSQDQRDSLVALPKNLF